MNEVSKLGQPEEEPEEVIEGRVIGPYEGPGGYWNWINEEMKLIVRAQMQEREARAYYHPATMQAFINGEWTYVHDVPEGSITYERGPSYGSYWTDEIQNWKDSYPQTVEFEFSSGDISDEAFKLMTGYDRTVLVAASKLGTQAPVPPVEPDRVKWPEGKDMKWTRRHSSPSPYSQWPSYP